MNSVMRAAFVTSFVLTALGFIAFWTLLNVHDPSNRQFKQSGTRQQAGTYVAQWRESGQLRKANRNLAVDWLFIALYSATWISGGLWLYSCGSKIALLFTAIGLLGAIADVVEDICLWIMLHGNASELAPRVCVQAMRVNFACFAIAAACFVVAAIRAWRTC
jgi:hypothetical protein